MGFYQKCLQDCEFYVTQDDSRCPNCGLVYPLRPFAPTVPPFEHTHKITLAVQWTLVILSTIFIFGFSLNTQMGAWGTCCVIPVAIVSFLITMPIGKWLGEMLAEIFIKRRNKESETEQKYIAERLQPFAGSLIGREEIIRKRKNDIRRELARIEETLIDIELNVKKNKEQQKNKLLSDKEALIRFDLEYSLGSYETRLVRLDNQLRQFIYVTGNFSYGDITNMQKSLLAIKDKIDSLESEMNKKTENVESPKLIELRELLSDTKTNIQTLYDEFADMRTKTVSSDSETLDRTGRQLSLPPMNTKENLEVTKIQIDKFSEEFNQLEYEFSKLKL
jgi:hypothetical protein